MAIVKKSELFKKAERDYRKIQRFNDKRIRALSSEDRRSVLDECVPQIRKMLLPIIMEIRSKLSYIPGYDLIEYAIKKLREAAILSLNIFYEALVGKNINAPDMNNYGAFVLALSCGMCNGVWVFIFMGAFALDGVRGQELEDDASHMMSIMIAPVIEEAAKSVALEKGIGYKYTFGFASLEFIDYVARFAPVIGPNIIVIRAIAWLFHFFTLVVQDIIPDKTFSFFLAVMCHMAWNAGVGVTIMSPLFPKHKELSWK